MLNKDKNQAYRIQFTDKKIRHNNAIASSFRKPVSHESDEIAQLAEEVCQEHFELDFQDKFSSSVQDLIASAASKELRTQKVERGMHQGDKVVVIDS